MAESPLIESLASYISGALARELPAEVEEKTKQHVLDYAGPRWRRERS